MVTALDKPASAPMGRWNTDHADAIKKQAALHPARVALYVEYLQKVSALVHND
jgi:hypothetical protein